MVKLDDLVKKIITAILVLLLLFFLWWHFRLSSTRYFDVDEFAHMSWTAHWVAGQRPYIDFMTFFPPGFMAFLAPVFLLGNTGVLPIMAARLLMFLVYLGILGCLGYLFRILRASWLWIVAVIFLAFLPLPKDKFIEIRPDSLATLLGLAGMIFQIQWFRERQARDAVVAGVFYSMSLLVLPKMVPQVAVALAVGLWAGIGEIRDRKEFRKQIPALYPFLMGLVIPFVPFGLWALLLGNPGTVLYSLTKLPVEANKISEVFIMLPNLFFYPNGIFYGENGYSLGLKINHILWITGLLAGAYRLLTPYVTRQKRYVPEEILMAGIFFIHVLFYTLLVPLKHTQYLIPIAVFIAFYAADAVYMAWQGIRKRPAGLVVFLFLGITGSVLLFEAYVRGNEAKLTWTNVKSVAYLKNLYKTIPTTEYILDMDGRTMYYPYPYYACCIPFGQSSPYLSHPLPSLSEALERTQTKYIYQGELKRTDTLRPEDQAYIQAHYLPYNGDTQLLVRK